MTPEERYAAAQARVNAADELRAQRSGLEFRVTVEVEAFTKAEPDLNACKQHDEERIASRAKDAINGWCPCGDSPRNECPRCDAPKGQPMHGDPNAAMPAP